MQSYCAALGFRQTYRLLAARGRQTESIAVGVRGIRFPVRCRPSQSDYHALRQVFIEHDSDVSLPGRPKFIIDGGANVGYASVLFANRYPDAVIYAIEPEECNCRIAGENFSFYPNIRLIQGGLWTEDAFLSIENADADSWAFTVRVSDERAPNSFPGVTIPTLLKQSGFDAIDLIKLDIEGTETAIFSDPDLAWLEKTGVVVIEVHGEEAHRAVLEAFHGRPFRHTQCGEKHIFIREGSGRP